MQSGQSAQEDQQHTVSKHRVPSDSLGILHESTWVQKAPRGYALSCNCGRRGFQLNVRMVTYVSIHSGVAPHIPGQFMDLSIQRALNLEPNRDATLCKEFTVEEFALTLRGLVTKPEFYYAESWIHVSELDDILKPYNKNSLQWLREVWSFLSSFLKGRPYRSENQSKLFPSSFLKGRPYRLEDQDKEIIDKLLKPLRKCCLCRY